MYMRVAYKSVYFDVTDNRQFGFFFFFSLIYQKNNICSDTVFGHISMIGFFSTPNIINHRCVMTMTRDTGRKKHTQNSCSATVLWLRGLWIINRRHRNYAEGAWNVKKFRKNEHHPRLPKGLRQENMMKR